MLQSLDTVILIIDLSPGYFHDQLFDGLVLLTLSNQKSKDSLFYQKIQKHSKPEY